MRLKKHLNILNILFLALFLITIGCEEKELGDDFISKPPELDYTKDSVFQSERRAKELLWNAYSTLPFGLPTVHYVSDWLNRTRESGLEGGGYSNYWNWTDEAGKVIPWSGKSSWQKGTVNPSSINSYQHHGLEWEAIRDSWMFIENLDQVPDMDEDPEKLKAEAKMIIATHYVEMFRTYGGILWVNHAYLPTENTENERLTVMQSVDTITSLIDEAKQHLPLHLENPEVWSGRFTKAGALALKVKLLEFAAAPLFNNDEPYMSQSYEAVSEKLVWTGGYNRNLWVRLRDVCEELINIIEGSSYYGMVNTGNPRQDFMDAFWDRGSGETLLSHRKYYWINLGDWRESPAVVRAMGWGGYVVPMHNLAMKFPMENGMNIQDPGSGYDPANPYANRDPRLYETVYVNNQSDWKGRTCELWIGGRDRRSIRNKQSAFGYYMRKWHLDFWGASGREVQWPYLRVPEVYLAYAEALNELNDGPTPTAVEYANKTRDRVGVDGILEYIGKDNVANVTKEEFLDALLNERAIEFAFEGKRLFDMQRHKLVDVYGCENYAMDTELKDGVQPPDDWRNVDFSEHDQYFNYEVTTTDIASFDAWQEDFNPRTLLYPFPYDEVQKDFGLIQNPGWEIE